MQLPKHSPEIWLTIIALVISSVGAVFNAVYSVLYESNVAFVASVLLAAVVGFCFAVLERYTEEN